MANLIYIKLDYDQILQDRLFVGKGGKRYLDLVCVPSANSKYGDTHFITQSATKEERAAGLKLPIIGNAKEQPPYANRGETPFDGQKQQRPAPKPAPAAQENLDEDVPF